MKGPSHPCRRHPVALGRQSMVGQCAFKEVYIVVASMFSMFLACLVHNSYVVSTALLC